MDKKDIELRVSAQTADGITVGFIEYLPHDTNKDALNTRTDLLVEVLTRQRMKVLLAGEEDTLEREKATVETLRKQLVDLEAKAHLEATNRKSGIATTATETNVQNVRTNLNHVEAQIASREKGIESLRKLAG